MRRTYYLVFAILLIVLTQSCVSSKRMYLFSDQTLTLQSIKLQRDSAQQKIQKGDRVSITVSCQDPSQTAFLNPFNNQNVGSAGIQSNSGYLVSLDGEIEFPLLGKLQIENLSSGETATLIRRKLSTYYKDPYVYVTLTGKVFFVSDRDGTTIPILNERLTIFEALSQSGKQDVFDKKNKVWIVREEKDKRTYTQVDLNQKDIFNSPYYYLHNNDLIYIQSGKYASLTSSSNPLKTALAISGTALAIFFALKK